MTLPSESLAVVAHARRRPADRRPAPAPPGPDEAVVEIAYGGICGSDLHYWTHGAAGESILRAPMVLGHEVVGTVVAAADGTGPAVGTRVAVHPATPAGDGVDPLPRRIAEPLARLAPTSAARLGFPHTDGRVRQVRDAAVAGCCGSCPTLSTCATAALIEPASVAWHAVSRAGDVDRQDARW